jgi:hypothetical protein
MYLAAGSRTYPIDKEASDGDIALLSSSCDGVGENNLRCRSPAKIMQFEQSWNSPFFADPGRRKNSGSNPFTGEHGCI